MAKRSVLIVGKPSGYFAHTLWLFLYNRNPYYNVENVPYFDVYRIEKYRIENGGVMYGLVQLADPGMHLLQP